MKRIVCVISVILLLIGCSSADNTEYAEKLISSKAEYAEFISNTESYLTECGFQGSVLISKGTDIIFAKGYGLSDSKTPHSPAINALSVFEIGSITKQMTAACILKLEEEGLLSTEDKLSLYYPDYKYGDDITIDMLLHMRSGLKDHIDGYEMFYPKDVADALYEAEYSCTPVEEGIAMKYFPENDLLSQPDTRFSYCNLNYHILADIIEKVSGKSYDDYVRENIFDVCGMTSSNLDFQGTTTVGYDRNGRYYSIPKSICKGAGEINSTVIDLWKCNNSLFSGKVIGEEALKKMTSAKGSYACGLFANSFIVFHGGSTDVFNSYNIIYLKDNIQIIVLINRPIEEMDSSDIAGEIRRIYDESLC